ncbi:hypothetical protein G6F66_014978 [Rhizopus arrhizus]|nr:hypothetical protein G6F66_014978 [Rhizopus arrhizus]
MTAGPHGRIGAVFAPGCQLRHDQFFDQRRRAGAAVFPREIAVPVLPAHLRHAGFAGLAGQAKIADRHDPRARLVGAVAIGEARPARTGETVRTARQAKPVRHPSSAREARRW